MSLLSQVVRRDIVPNLIIANRVIGAEARGLASEPGRQDRITPDSVWHDAGFNAERGERDLKFASGHIRMVDVARFVRLLRGTGAEAAPALVDVLVSRGIPRSELYLNLLAPAARMIGDMWQDDECSFADVTMVVARLHQILNGLRDEEPVVAAPPDAPKILLSAAPGEQHSFGIAVVETMFQDAGWQTRLSNTNDAEDLLDQVRQQRFEAVGFSLSHADLADVLRATVMRLRSVSLNRDILVLVGGPSFQSVPDLVQHVGADAEVGAGAEAARKARDLLPRHDRLYV
jgi:methanogenic corrinoid protein MtbC1